VVNLRTTQESELTKIVDLENRPDVREYVTPAPLEEHQKDYADDDVTYLTIEHEGNFAGFIILVDHPEDTSVECLRIAVGILEQGIGQQALNLMEAYCKETYNPKRIWLDVYAHNKRGIHVYTKLGYQQFDTGIYEGKDLLYLEKVL
jgi:diamine N-acetyltransferase